MVTKKYQQDILDYNSNPNKCKNCGASILHQDGKKLSETKIKQFCDRKCANMYFNLQRIKKRFCQNCGKGITSKNAKYCDDCRKYSYNTKHIDLMNKTKGELINKNGYFKARSSICKNARTIFYRETKDVKCAVCGYDKYIEVCHIKAVKDFNDDTKISEINCIDNLIGLCPNHHKEYDNGLIHF